MNDTTPNSVAADPLTLARACADAMYARDAASQALGAVLVDVGPGRATMTMLLRPDMLNGHGSGHGGFLFALADSTFAFACNSRNEATVAAGCSIEYLRPVPGGTQLIATAAERALAGRSGIYDVTLSDAAGTVFAVFRGKSARVQGPVIPS